jgi:glutamate transport system substrate-binding protein
MTDGGTEPETGKPANGGTEPETGKPPGAAQAAGGRRSAALARLVVVLAVLVVVVVVGITVAVTTGPPSEGDLLKQAGMTGKHELLVGVKDDQPGVGLRDKATGRYTGFDVDIAYMIASDLGFRPSEVRFMSIESEDRARMSATDPVTKEPVQVDMVVASFSITKDRMDKGVLFSAPYLRTEQSVVTRKDHRPVEALNALARDRVCTIGTSTSAQALEAKGITNVSLEKQISTCIAGLVAPTPSYDAVSTDAAILAGFVHDPQYRGLLEHHDIALDTEEKWGVAASSKALQTLVNLSLYRSLNDPDDRRWEDAYDRNLRPEQEDSKPQAVAIGQQPPVDRPAVREWPWHR